MNMVLMQTLLANRRLVTINSPWELTNDLYNDTTADP